MSRKLFRLEQFKNIKINFFLFLVLLFASINAIAQKDKMSNELSNDLKKPYKTISYGEKIFFGKIESSATWIVINLKENKTVNLIGDQINDFVFETAGSYEVNFFENKEYNDDTCKHHNFNSKMIVEVSPIKMTFDFSIIKFSQKIQKGQSCDGIVVTVPVNFQTIKESDKVYTIFDFTVAGIGVNLIGKPIEKKIVVKNGIHFIKYQLFGIVKSETYLMFDFVDFNKNIQTYNQSEIVN